MRCERIPVRPGPCLRNSLSQAGHANPPGIGISLAQIAGITKSRQRAADAPPRDWHIACGNCGNPRHGLPARYRERNEGGAERAETHFSPISIRKLFLGATLVTAMLASPTAIQSMVFLPPWPASTAPLRSAKSPWSTRGQSTRIASGTPHNFQDARSNWASRLSHPATARAPRSAQEKKWHDRRPGRQLVGSFARQRELRYLGSMVPTYSGDRGEAPRAIRKFPIFSMWESRKPPSLVLTYSGLAASPKF